MSRVSEANIALAHSLDQIPSVTQILRAVGLAPTFNGVPAQVLERKRQLGQALHRAIQYDVEGVLDESSLHPDIAGGFAAYRAVRASGFLIDRAEVEVVDAEWRVMGHPDALGTDPQGAPAIIDWKAVHTIDLDAVAYQVAAYMFLGRRANLGERVPFAIQLLPDGTFRVHRLAKRIAELQAEQVFQAAVLLYHATARRTNRRV